MAVVGAAVAVLAVPGLAHASVAEVNAQRAAAGLPPVSEDSGLTSLAVQRSAQNAATSSLVHTSNLGGAVGSVTPSYTGAGENVGTGQSVSSITSMFMASPSHRSTILGNYNTAGVGVVAGRDGRVWVTQVFARTSAGGAVASRVVVRSSGGSRNVRRGANGRRHIHRVVHRHVHLHRVR